MATPGRLTASLLLALSLTACGAPTPPEGDEHDERRWARETLSDLEGYSYSSGFQAAQRALDGAPLRCFTDLYKESRGELDEELAEDTEAGLTHRLVAYTTECPELLDELEEHLDN